MAENRNRATWDASECSLVLIDYQPEMFNVIYSMDHKIVVTNICAVTQAAVKFGIPVVLTTVAVKKGINSPTIEPLKKLLPGVPEVDRMTMAAWEEPKFVEAVTATGRKRLVMGGLLTEECLTWGVIDGLKQGYEVSFVADAVAGGSQVEHDIAVLRMIQAGAIPNTSIATIGEWFRDWTTPNAQFAREIFVPLLAEKAERYKGQQRTVEMS
jgi:nicotinamidase-related amidase